MIKWFLRISLFRFDRSSKLGTSKILGWWNPWKGRGNKKYKTFFCQNSLFVKNSLQKLGTNISTTHLWCSTHSSIVLKNSEDFLVKAVLEEGNILTIYKTSKRASLSATSELNFLFNSFVLFIIYYSLRNVNCICVVQNSTWLNAKKEQLISVKLQNLQNQSKPKILKHRVKKVKI